MYRRHSRWGKKGVWKLLLEQVFDDIDLEQLLLDGRIIRVHQHGAGAKKEGPQAIGRWRGGLTTKIHSAVDALGNPLRSILTTGQDSDPGTSLDGGFGS